MSSISVIKARNPVCILALRWQYPITTATGRSHLAIQNQPRSFSHQVKSVKLAEKVRPRKEGRRITITAMLDVEDSDESGKDPSLSILVSSPGITQTPEPTGSENTRMDLKSNKSKWILAETTMPIYLKFTDIKYKVTVKGMMSSSEKEILNGISGSARPGEVLALMGPSGSGKTTMLSLLGGRIKSSNPSTGSITYNGHSYSKALKRRMGFVTQDDVLYAHLTVKETLTYAALLRLPKTMTKRQKEEKVTDVIHKLGLDRCQDTMVGGSFVRGVSGGERKRVCIGNDILINPSLLLLDEPTSGLDSTTALKTMLLLRDIAEAGKTVVASVHQPSSRMLHHVDKLILLGKGKLLYFGRASEVMNYYSAIGFSPLIAMNPAEFLLDLANGNTNDISMPSQLGEEVQEHICNGEILNVSSSLKAVHQYIVEAYQTRVDQELKRELPVKIPTEEDLKDKLLATTNREWGASWRQQYTILFRRGLKERRHEYLSLMKVIQVLATAFILGLLWWQSDISTPNGLQEQAGLLFFMSVFWSFFPVYTAIFTFPQERAMINKERAVDMYRLSAYFIARTTSDMPLDLFLPLIFLMIVYFMAGLRADAAPFFLSILIVFLNIVSAQGLGLAVGAAVMDIKKAATLASVVLMTFMLAGGFFVQRVPVFISWMRYLSFNYHTYRLLLKVQYGHLPAYIERNWNDHSVTSVIAMVVMIFGYRLLSYLLLRMMKLQN